MQGKDISPGSTNPTRASLSPGGRIVDRGEEFVYILVSGLLLITAAVTCGYAGFSALSYLQRGDPLQGIFSLVNDLLLVLIIMEVLRTVPGFCARDN